VPLLLDGVAEAELFALGWTEPAALEVPTLVWLSAIGGSLMVSSAQAENMLTTPKNPNNAVIFFMSVNIVYKSWSYAKKLFYYL